MNISKSGKENQKTTKLFREFSSGGVVFKKVKDKIFWLVTSSAPSKEIPKSYWRFPKGHIDSGESVEKAAVREVKEEGGIKAKIVNRIGTEKYIFTISGKRIFKIVTYFLMEWVKDTPEEPDFETAEVAWLPYEQCRKKLSFSSSKKMLDKAKEILDKGIQQNLI